jgi:hypothetical protein
MAGTFSDQAVLASDNAFINKCRAAMLFRANELMAMASPPVPRLGTLQQATQIIRSSGSDASNMAWIVATTNPTIAAAAPAVPTDGDVQFAVNTQLTASIAQI